VLVGALERARDVAPRELAVQPHADPPEPADVRRHEVVLRLAVDQHRLRARRRGAPQREPAIAVMVVAERGHLPLAHEPRRRPVAELLFDLRPGRDDRPDLRERAGRTLG